MAEAIEISEARRVLRIEAESILAIEKRLDDNFVQAVNKVIECQGKLICVGMGKSGQIARKLASTFSSTGTPAMFLHPAESSHGDLGVISQQDTVLAISYGGDSPEWVHLLNFIERRGITLIALTGNMDSSLARAGIVTLNVKVEEEACPLGLAPTSSSTATLALGDALAMAVLKRRGFSQEEFAEFHPGGSLGRRLLTRVRDVMHTELPVLSPEANMSEVVAQMTGKEVKGVAGIVDSDGSVVGVVTDGDIRRRLERCSDPLTETASQLMSHSPKTIDVNELAQKALFVMEQFRIQILFVVDKTAENPNKPVGVLHIQDLLRARLR